MKCPNCGEEVDSGNLYCPKCLQEIPWVPEYHTMETIQNQQEFSRKKRIQRVKDQIRQQNLPGKRRKKRFFAVCCLGIAILIAIPLGGYLYSYFHSYAYQYHSAKEHYEAGEYEKALEHIDRAITQRKDHAEAYCLLADVLDAQGDVDGAIKVMESRLADFSENVSVYGELIALYEENEQPEKIKQLLDECGSVSVRNQFPDYITADPILNYDSGSYSEKISVKISGECQAYYYTLDGSKPSHDALKYEKAIPIGEGTTELKAIGYNTNGIPSDVIYRKYVVSLEAPDPPVIQPDSGYYEENTTITMQVPDGFTCYYAFDETPDTSGTKYQGPINMPTGTHTIYAFLAAGSKKSEVVTRTYTLVY